ncbi:MAG: epoxyqueuosine reductase [Deltaproteobacteria bacterium]|nr:epoxyqueuosine reductase [Deltaproteobacteria bacterium]
MDEQKNGIRAYALDAGADDVGFVAAADYRSARSPALSAVFPGTESLVVLAVRGRAGCESPSPQLAMNGRLDLMEFSRSVNYKVGRFLERELGARASTVPLSYPLDMGGTGKGTLGDVSLRHAAVGAGLGAFGQHNLVVHPRFGSRVLFTAVLTDLVLPSDSVLTENPCTACGACLAACPARALEEGKTDVMKCLGSSQPYGLGASVRFWTEFGAGGREERKRMLRDPDYWRLYQAGFIGFQYFCFRCLESCPVGQRQGVGRPGQ